MTLFSPSASLYLNIGGKFTGEVLPWATVDYINKKQADGFRSRPALSYEFQLK